MKPVELDPDLFADAKGGQREATVRLLSAFYPSVYRVAAALTGRRDVARKVARHILSRGLELLPKWAEPGAPDRWFRHHTLLLARRVKLAAPPTNDDALVTAARSADGGNVPMPYLAFVVALRQMPRQQAEAYLLHHGEGLTVRQLGVAMDCSQQAAGQHLDTADRTMRAIAGDSLEPLSDRLVRAYRSLTPDLRIVVPAVSAAMRRRRRRRLLRGLLIVLVGAALIAAAWVGWRVWLVLER